MKTVAKSIPQFETVDVHIARITHNIGNKMFVITHDIKVRDEVEIHGVKTAIVVKGPHRKKGETIPLNKAKRNGWYKILGRLSPNATWVKDGDEIKIAIDTTTGFVIFYGEGIFANGRCSVDNKARGGEYIKAQCPTCNTYH